MEEQLINTKNVIAFYHGVDVLQEGVAGRKGIMLATGEVGTGKTSILKKSAVDSDAVYTSALFVSTPKGFLKGMVTELGEEPKGHSDSLFRQAVNNLIAKPRTIFIDEIDYLIKSGAVMIVKDLINFTNVPIVIAGEKDVDRRLRMFTSLFSRIRVIVRFELFDKNELETIGKQKWGLSLGQNVIDYVHKESGGRIREASDLFKLCERLLKTNKLKQVEMDHLRPAWENEKKRIKQ